MTDDKADKLTSAVVEHGNQLSQNLMYFKKFTEAQNRKQEAFLAKLQSENDKLQKQSVNAARWAAGAATAAALAALAPIVGSFL